NGSTFAIGASNNLIPAPWVTVSGTEFEVNAALLDFNGNADISGSLTVDGTITGNGSGLTSLNASNLSSGTLPDARLSSNVPRLNSSNSFSSEGVTAPPIFFTGNAGYIGWNEADAGADERQWRLGVNAKL